MPGKRHRYILSAVVVAGLLGWSFYAFEPRMFNFDDGPYGSREFEGGIDPLPLQSRVELKRIGNVAYVLESRLLSDEGASVLVLKRPDGSICWKRVPIKPDGPLGPIALHQRHTRPTWYGGWKVAITPALQEGGHLYLGPFGGFRFFYHSW